MRETQDETLGDLLDRWSKTDPSIRGAVLSILATARGESGQRVDAMSVNAQRIPDFAEFQKRQRWLTQALGDAASILVAFSNNGGDRK